MFGAGSACRDALRLGTAGILLRWAGCSVVALQRSHTGVRAVLGYSAVRYGGNAVALWHCRDIPQLGTPGILGSGALYRGREERSLLKI